ncbi:MAG: hypothetical protein FRX49_11660, partial [Trebouxia sp. A1-2]
EHPDTVGGAMLTGVREAVRALRMLKGASEEEANAAAGGVDGGLPSRKRKQADGLLPSASDFMTSGDESGGGKSGAQRRRSLKDKPRKSRMMKKEEDADVETASPEVRPQRSAADVRRELEAREEARNHVKLIWRALAAMASGESDGLVALLQRSTSAAQRMQVLECLQRETPDTRLKLANDAPCLGALEEWVLDLIEDRMSFHVLETLLKVLLMLPVRWGALKESNLAHTVYKGGLLTHPNKGVKSLAESLCKQWTDAAPVKKPRGNPEGLNGVITPSPASHIKAEPKAESKAESAHDDSDAVMEDVKAELKSPPPPKQQELAPEIAARIAEAERIAAEAEAEAAAYAEHAAAIQAEHDLQQQQEHQDRSDKVQSFSKFQAELRAQQRQTKSGHKHKHDKREKRYRADKPATPKATPVATLGQADNMKEDVGVYVGELLKPRFKSNAISKEDYKWVVRKTVEKVAASATGVSGGEFLNEKRKVKINQLVEHYVSQRKHDRSATSK